METAHVSRGRNDHNLPASSRFEITPPIGIPSRSMSVLAALMVLLFGILGSGVAWAAEPVEIAGVRVGLNGRFKLGMWNALDVHVTGPAGTSVTCTVTTPDPNGQPVVTEVGSGTLDANGESWISGGFRSGRLDAALRLQLHNTEDDSNAIVATRIISTGGTARTVDGEPIRALPPLSRMWLVVGEQPAFAEAAKRWNDSGAGEVSVGRFDGLQRLPDDAQVLEGLDLAVLPASLEVTPPQSEVLREWVARGGRLVITAGTGGRKLRDGALGSWLPSAPIEEGELHNLGGLSSVVPGSSLLRVRGTVPAAQLPNECGAILATGLEGPLAIRDAYGFGTVTILGVDLDRRPLSTWDEDSQALLALFLADESAPWVQDLGATGTAPRSSELNPTGVSDLQTQLNNSLDHFEGVERASHWNVLGWMALLLLLVGPVDYLLVHTWLGRPHLTWLTLPVWIGVVSFSALSLGNSSNESPLTTRQIDLLDVDAAQGIVRGRSWLGLYSPVTHRYRITARPSNRLVSSETTKRAAEISWVARPEAGFRGMYRPGGLNLGEAGYRIDRGEDEINNLPVRIWSSTSVGYEWSEEDKALTSELIDANLTATGGNRLQGTITHHFPGQISDWFIAYGSFAYMPRTSRGEIQQPLEAGTTWSLKGAKSNILRGVLIRLSQGTVTGRDGKREETVVSRENYDPLNLDPFDILRVTSFHDVAGGSGYTGLHLQAMPGGDLSPLVELDRAVLFGKLRVRSATFKVDDRPAPIQDHNAFVRVVIPVERKARSENAPPTSDLLRVP